MAKAKKQEPKLLKFTYLVDLGNPQSHPVTTFEGPWSRHHLDIMLKKARRGMIQFKREKLREELKNNERAESKPRSEYKPTGGQRAKSKSEPEPAKQ